MEVPESRHKQSASESPSRGRTELLPDSPGQAARPLGAAEAALKGRSVGPSAGRCASVSPSGKWCCHPCWLILQQRFRAARPGVPA